MKNASTYLEIGRETTRSVLRRQVRDTKQKLKEEEKERRKETNKTRDTPKRVRACTGVFKLFYTIVEKKYGKHSEEHQSGSNTPKKSQHGFVIMPKVRDPRYYTGRGISLKPSVSSKISLSQARARARVMMIHVVLGCVHLCRPCPCRCCGCPCWRFAGGCAAGCGFARVPRDP